MLLFSHLLCRPQPLHLKYMHKHIFKWYTILICRRRLRVTREWKKNYAPNLNDGKWHVFIYVEKKKKKKTSRWRRRSKTTYQEGQPSFLSLLMEQINGWIFFPSFLHSFLASSFLLFTSTHTAEHILPLCCFFFFFFFRFTLYVVAVENSKCSFYSPSKHRFYSAFAFFSLIGCFICVWF